LLEPVLFQTLLQCIEPERFKITNDYRHVLYELVIGQAYISVVQQQHILNWIC